MRIATLLLPDYDVNNVPATDYICDKQWYQSADTQFWVKGRLLQVFSGEKLLQIRRLARCPIQQVGENLGGVEILLRNPAGMH